MIAWATNSIKSNSLNYFFDFLAIFYLVFAYKGEQHKGELRIL